MIGDEVILKIELTNNGSGAATDVILLENVPPQFRHPYGQDLEFVVGRLEPNERRELELVLTAVEPGAVRNVLTVRGDANIQIQDEVEVQIIAPELEVAVDGPGRRYLERKASYMVSVNNPGTAPAKDVEVAVFLPQGMQFVKADKYGEYEQTSHSVHWSLEELPPRRLGNVQFVAMPVEPGEHIVRVEGKAEQELTASAEHTVSVEGIAAIMFEVFDVKDPIAQGTENVYEIRVTNTGSKAATKVHVTAEAPGAGMQFQ